MNNYNQDLPLRDLPENKDKRENYDNNNNDCIVDHPLIFCIIWITFCITNKLSMLFIPSIIYFVNFKNE